jgi:hypothetical protein
MVDEGRLRPSLLLIGETTMLDAGRDARGRFTRGNPYAVKGWAALVNQRFAGDELMAKKWLGQLGRFAYASMFHPQARTATIQRRLQTVYIHPGTPEEFIRRLTRLNQEDIVF